MEISSDTKGIQKIKIPFKKEDLANFEVCKSTLVKYLDKCLDIQFANAQKEQDLQNYYNGLQDIQFKQRKFKSDSATNTKTCENHALAQVDFLTDYLLSEKVKLSSKNADEIDDISVLETLLLDANFYTSFREAKKDMFMLGVGVSYAEPRIDILENDGKETRYKKDYNKDTQAPFKYTYLDPKYNFVIYSSYAGEEPLICVSLVDITLPNEIPTYDVSIWTREYYFRLKASKNQQGESNYIFKFSDDNFISQVRQFNDLPIIETTCNKERLGIIETNRDLYNLVNMVTSIGADAVYDTINQVFVFENVEIDGDQFDDMIANKAITITSTGNETTKPNVYTIEVKFNQADVNVLTQNVIEQMYNIAGVPQASGNTSTGITGNGQRYGGGWENAEIKMNGRIIGMQSSDYDLLKLLLDICHLVPNTKINELYASQIEMTYRLSMNDNILSKAQSASNLYQIHMPLESILKICRLSNDVSNDAKKWQEEIDKAEEKAKAINELATKNNQDKAMQQSNASQEQGINQKGVKDIKSDI